MLASGASAIKSVILLEMMQGESCCILERMAPIAGQVLIGLGKTFQGRYDASLTHSFPVPSSSTFVREPK